MRQVAGDRQHQIVMVRRHGLDLGAQRGPERAELRDRVGIGAIRGSEDAPAIDEQLGETGIGTGVLGAGDGVRRHEMDAGRQMRRHLPRDRALDRTDIGDDRAWLEIRRDFLRDRATGADRDAQDDEVGALGRFGVALNHGIDDAKLPDPRAGLLRARGGDDLACQALQACGARDRAADQAEADQRDPFE